MEARETNWVSGLTFFGGVWLIVAPWILGYNHVDSVVWNEVIIGIAVAGVSLFQLAYREAAGWVNALLGVWLIAAPFALGYSGTGRALWNEIIVGAALVLLGGGVALVSRGVISEDVYSFGEKIEKK